jgi:hypothetical protein
MNEVVVMLASNIFSTLFISALLLFTGATPACDKNSGQNTNGTSQISKPVNKRPQSGEKGTGDMTDPTVKTLAEGAYADVTEPFVAVIREAGTYSELKKIVSGLPDLGDDAFNKGAVVAAFLGQRSTGGYSVDVRMTPDGKIRISQIGPPKGAMVTQALTSPFKVVMVPTLGPEAQLAFDSDVVGKNHGKEMRVEKGQFTITGGFAGLQEEFALGGSLRVMKMGGLVSVAFNLKGVNSKKPRTLQTIATGTIDPSGKLQLPRFDAGTLIEPPQPFLTASGTLASDLSTLDLTMQSVLSRVIADGFVGKGSLTARSAL